SFWSISSSMGFTFLASSMSFSSKALAAVEMASSHRAPVVISATLSCSSCSSNLVLISFLFLSVSAKPAGDVVFGALILGHGEHLLGGAKLHQLAQQEERRLIRDTRRLLHVMRHNNDSIV